MYVWIGLNACRVDEHAEVGNFFFSSVYKLGCKLSELDLSHLWGNGLQQQVISLLEVKGQRTVKRKSFLLWRAPHLSSHLMWQPSVNHRPFKHLFGPNAALSEATWQHSTLGLSQSHSTAEQPSHRGPLGSSQWTHSSHISPGLHSSEILSACTWD